MTQKERRIYLIGELLKERPDTGISKSPKTNRSRNGYCVLFSMFVCPRR